VFFRASSCTLIRAFGGANETAAAPRQLRPRINVDVVNFVIRPLAEAFTEGISFGWQGAGRALDDLSFASQVYDYVATMPTSTDVAKVRCVRDETIAVEQDQPTEIRTTEANEACRRLSISYLSSLSHGEK